jgi:VWFA-related protein
MNLSKVNERVAALARIAFVFAVVAGGLAVAQPGNEAVEATAVPPAEALPQQGEDYVIPVDVRLVVLHTTVRDKKDHLVTDLTQSDFKIFEDGQQQTLKIFRREDVPVSLGILVDNSGSMRDKRLKVNAAAVDFVKASHPQDEVFIVNFNDEAFLDRPFTHDIALLQDALQRIDARGGTAFYDAIGMSQDYLSEKAKWDKRVLLVITDGEDNASRDTLEKLVRQMQETNTVVYVVGLLGEEDRRSAKRAERAIKNIVRSTGGAAFFPETVDEVHELAQQVATDIRNQYILAYSPASEKGPGFRQVKVELQGKARRY